MFTLKNVQSAILNVNGEKTTIKITCDTRNNLNSIDVFLARQLLMPSILPRIWTNGEFSYPISRVPFTIELTSIEGETKIFNGEADVSDPLRQFRQTLILGNRFLKEIEANIIIA